MQSENPEVRRTAAKEWNRWDLTISALLDPPSAYDRIEDDKWCLTHAMLETHYFSQGGFLAEGELLRNSSRISNMLGMIFVRLLSQESGS